MTKAELVKKSGFSLPTVNDRIRKGQTEEEIIADGTDHHKPKRARTRLTGETFAEARQRKEIALANQHEITAAQMLGEVVEVASVNAWIAGMILKSRDILLRMAPEFKDKLSQETDSAIIEQLLDAEVRRALMELAMFKSQKAD